MSDKKNAMELPESAETKKAVSPLRIVVCLALICIVTAALLGTVNYFTAPTIEENENNEKQEAIKEIFGDRVTAQLISREDADGEIYVILSDGMVYGYCAEVEPNGFMAEIKMMVGVDLEGKVCGVNIVSMQETPGLGSRTNQPSFLDQFLGKSGELNIGVNVDAVSGATVSSRAVTRGVTEALSLEVDLEAIAAGMNTTLWSAEGAQTDAVTEPPETKIPETESAEPDTTEASLRLEDSVDYVERIDAVPGVSDGEAAIYVDVHTDTDAFLTETVEPPKDWAGNYIFPEEDNEDEEVDG